MHTPGPLKFGPNTLTIYQEGTGTPVAKIVGPGFGYPFPHELGTAIANGVLLAAAPDLLAALTGLNHMGGDERGGYCICPRKDGSAPDAQHSTACADARAALAKAGKG